MSYKINKHPLVFKVLAVIAMLFGLLTLKSGGMVLFTEGAARQAAGDYVPFVLWFNFIAGFGYVIAAFGLWMQRSWTGLLATIIAVSTLVVFLAFGVHIFAGGAYETRTVVAMTMRSVVWVAIAVIITVISRRYT